MQASFFCTILAIFPLSSIFNKIDNRYKAPEKTKGYKNSQQQLKQRRQSSHEISNDLHQVSSQLTISAGQS